MENLHWSLVYFVQKQSSFYGLTMAVHGCELILAGSRESLLGIQESFETEWRQQTELGDLVL